MNKETIELIHRELTTLENSEKKICFGFGEREFLCFVLRILGLLNLAEIRKGTGINKGLLTGIERILEIEK